MKIGVLKREIGTLNWGIEIGRQHDRMTHWPLISIWFFQLKVLPRLGELVDKSSFKGFWISVKPYMGILEKRAIRLPRIVIGIIPKTDSFPLFRLERTSIYWGVKIWRIGLAYIFQGRWIWVIPTKIKFSLK